MKKIRYPISSYAKKRLDNWHYHGNVLDAERFTLINDKTKELAEMIVTMCPPSRNQSVALTNLEAVRMRANAAIAVDEGIYVYAQVGSNVEVQEKTEVEAPSQGKTYYTKTKPD